MANALKTTLSYLGIAALSASIGYGISRGQEHKAQERTDRFLTIVSELERAPRRVETLPDGTNDIKGWITTQYGIDTADPAEYDTRFKAATVDFCYKNPGTCKNALTGKRLSEKDLDLLVSQGPDKFPVPMVTPGTKVVSPISYAMNNLDK